MWDRPKWVGSSYIVISTNLVLDMKGFRGVMEGEGMQMNGRSGVVLM